MTEGFRQSPASVTDARAFADDSFLEDDAAQNALVKRFLEQTIAHIVQGQLRKLSAKPQYTRKSRATDREGEAGTKDWNAEEVFGLFEEQIRNLDHQLRELSNRTRKLGSSVGILSASSRLRERLGRILHLFRENAAGLFPHIVPRKDYQPAVFRRLASKRHGFFNSLNLTGHAADEVPQDFALELQLFSQDVSTLLACFSQFPEYLDEVPDRTLGSDLTHWALSLDDLKAEGTWKSHAVQTYLFDSMADIGERLDCITDRFIPAFISIGIPTIRAAQVHSGNNLVNLSAVATFFAGVTATMLQITWNFEPRSKLSDSVNAFWIISIIFSVSSAVNSLLGLSWTEAIFRSPDHLIPWWILIWVKRSPIAFLVLSVACFFVGIVQFSYLSSQAPATRIVTAALSATSCFGLLAMSVWFASERWIYSRYGGHLWLSDIFNQLRKRLIHIALSVWPYIDPRNIWTHGKYLVLGNAGHDVETGLSGGTRIGLHRRTTISADREDPEKPSFWLGLDKASMTSEEIARYRWQEALRRTRINTLRKLGKASGDQLEIDTKNSHYRLSRVVDTAEIAKLERMAIVHELQAEEAHESTVQCLQFSPDGRSLVTSSLDRSSFILAVTDNDLQREKTLRHSGRDTIVWQIEWALRNSGDTQHLLMRRSQAVSLWKRDEQSRWEEAGKVQGRAFRAVRWHGAGEGMTYLSVEAGRVVVMTLDDKESKTHRTIRIDDFHVRDIAVTDDLKWLLCVGKCRIMAKDNRKQKYEIVLYDLTEDKVAKRTSVFHEICDITLARDNRSVLVSYENRAPPQLWGFLASTTKRGNEWNLRLKHTYLPREQTSFSGLPAILGGTLDRLVLRAGIDGDFHVWLRNVGTLLYCIRAPKNFGQLTAFTWNRWSDEWMFATGTNEGAVHVWKMVEEEPEEIVRSPATPASSSSSPSFASRPTMFRGRGTHQRSPSQGRFVSGHRFVEGSSSGQMSRSGTYESSYGALEEEDETAYF
ncbi:WD40 repeat-like protein [Phanerochaete sordida]|uniref:WD40 repeat-like protein n=1 Tax=Phanerochaete sordida TaxID=48140 RepID=A0A9P3FYF4_9APHY|nr:WD40 repeat-like protein [Phanerochaete sordida]